MAVSGGVCSVLQLDLDVGWLVLGGHDLQHEGDPVTVAAGVALRLHTEGQNSGLRLLLELLPRRLDDGGEALAHLGHPHGVFEIDRQHPSRVVQDYRMGEVCLG